MKVRGCGVVVAVVADSDWVTAVDRATTRIGHTVARQVERMHDHHAARQRKASGLGLLYGGQE